ncbi:MAG: hypothetical protein M1813_007566 [Trichoglossum hirsutum]|nr:MAG: hypothetical protein M1813_007566 [Trichoglossum hirsutum]
MDRDMIPILERVDDCDFYSPIWRYSNCHPKAPPPSPAPSSDQQLTTVNSMASSPVWGILPLALARELSTASNSTAPSIVHDRYDTSSDEGYIGSEYDEEHAEHSVEAQSAEILEWLAIDYDVESTPCHHFALTTCDFQFDGHSSIPSTGQCICMDNDYSGIANTTLENVPPPRLSPKSAVGTSSPHQLPRTGDDNTTAPQHSVGTFSVSPQVHSHTNASIGGGSRHRESFPVLQMERSVFEDDDDNDGDHGGEDGKARGRRRFGSFSSHIRLPGHRTSKEQGKALKRRASSILHGILNCGWIRRT